MYNEVYNSAVLFYDNCPLVSSQRINGTNQSNEKSVLAKEETKYLIYPNPAKDEIFISTSQENKELTVLIQDINGRTVYQSQIILANGLGKINTELENGIYFVTIKTESFKAVQKLLITK